jgi:hypothetical protein
LTEVVLEGVEDLEQLVADPLAIAAAPDPRWDEHAGLLDAVQRGARCRWGHAVPGSGGVGTRTVSSSSISFQRAMRARSSPRCSRTGGRSA